MNNHNFLLNQKASYFRNLVQNERFRSFKQSFYWNLPTLSVLKSLNLMVRAEILLNWPIKDSQITGSAKKKQNSIFWSFFLKQRRQTEYLRRFFPSQTCYNLFNLTFINFIIPYPLDLTVWLIILMKSTESRVNSGD